jgi:hypothetical protein
MVLQTRANAAKALLPAGKVYREQTQAIFCQSAQICTVTMARSFAAHNQKIDISHCTKASR